MSNTTVANAPDATLGRTLAFLLRRMVTAAYAGTAVGEPAMGRPGTSGSRSRVTDAVDRTNLRDIAVAAAKLCDHVHWCAIDPGPFGPELANAIGLTHTSGAAVPILVASGSATTTTRVQLEAVERVLGGRFPTLEVLDINVDAAVERLLDMMAEGPQDSIVGVRTVDAHTEPRALSAREAQAIPDAIGHIVASVLDQTRVGGFHTTGGDVTLGVLDAVGCHGMAVDEEVIPPAVAGRLAGGRHPNMPIVTKGGLIGHATAAVACLDELRTRVALLGNTSDDAPTLPR